MTFFNFFTRSDHLSPTAPLLTAHCRLLAAKIRFHSDELISCSDNDHLHAGI